MLTKAVPSRSSFSVLCTDLARLCRRYAEAAKWISRAADQGLALAQFVLGGMYALGQGVPEDAVRAHMWLDLSAAQAAQIIGGITCCPMPMRCEMLFEQTISPAQIEESHKLAREWKPNARM